MTRRVLGRFARPLWGVAAFVGAYLVPYVLIAAGNPGPVFERIVVVDRYNGPTTLAELFETGVAEWKVAGMFHFGAQFVNTVVELPSGLHESVNPVLNAGGPYLLLLAVPPTALALAGFMATRNVRSPLEFTYDLGAGTWQRYAVNGAIEVTLGYLPVTMAVMLAHLWFPQPNAITGWIVAGMVYPTVFGGLGGVASYVLADEYEHGTTDAHYTLSEETN